MFISVMFKDKNKVFKGREYDYEVLTPPAVGSIIRMTTPDGSQWVCNGTRVLVTSVKCFSEKSYQQIGYKMSSLDEPSFSDI